MKTLPILAIACAALFTVSCTKQETPEPSNSKQTVPASKPSTDTTNYGNPHGVMRNDRRLFDTLMAPGRLPIDRARYPWDKI